MMINVHDFKMQSYEKYCNSCFNIVSKTIRNSSKWRAVRWIKAWRGGENAPQSKKISSADEIKMDCGRNFFRLRTKFSWTGLYAHTRAKPILLWVRRKQNLCTEHVMARRLFTHLIVRFATLSLVERIFGNPDINLEKSSLFSHAEISEIRGKE